MANLSTEKRGRIRLSRRRLLAVAKALRESPKPESFTMWRFGTVTFKPKGCGTPCCALGHYAARRDLQHVFSLTPFGMLRERRKRADIGFTDPVVLRHFGLSLSEARELFSQEGCGCAKTPIQAAEYIETFVSAHP